MKIYTSETVIEVTDEEINTISNLISFAEENDLDYDEFNDLLKAISDTKGKNTRSFCDYSDRAYTIKRIEKWQKGDLITLEILAPPVFWRCVFLRNAPHFCQQADLTNFPLNICANCTVDIFLKFCYTYINK